MAPKKGGLGKGLGSLFEETSSNTPETDGVRMLRISSVEPDKNQPRKVFDDTSLSELASSIMENGVLQPIIVRENPAGGYKIVSGERRWRASRLAGLTEIPALIKDISDEKAMEIALIENLQREDLDPIDEALGYKQLMDKCGYTQETAAARLAKSRSSVANSLRLLNLPKKVIEQLRKGELSQGHAKVILSLPDAKLQQQVADEVIKHSLNVRQTEILCKKVQKAEKTAPIKFMPPLPSEVELSLKEVLGTEIKVNYKDGKGSLNVSFYSDEQLKEFANLLGKYKKEK